MSGALKCSVLRVLPSQTDCISRSSGGRPGCGMLWGLCGFQLFAWSADTARQRTAAALARGGEGSKPAIEVLSLSLSLLLCFALLCFAWLGLAWLGLAWLGLACLLALL